MNKALKQIKPPSAFCILGISNVDLYKEGFNFLYGLAFKKAGTGIFSFARYDPAFEGQKPDPQSWFMRSTYVMVHELSHLFGLAHCIYYECTMNGVAHSEEQIRRA
jgi:archaemetzincin